MVCVRLCLSIPFCGSSKVKEWRYVVSWNAARRQGDPFCHFSCTIYSSSDTPCSDATDLIAEWGEGGYRQLLVLIPS